MKHIMYAHKSNKGFIHIYPHPALTKMCGPDEPIKVYVSELDKPLPSDTKEMQQIGWKKPDGYISLIQPCLMLYEMQFPYGFRAEEQAGHGKAICLGVLE